MIYMSTPDFYNDYIQHFNPYHNPKNGQFASGKGIIGSAVKSQKQHSVELNSKQHTQTIEEKTDPNRFDTEKEYNDWVAAGRPKRIAQKYTTTITTKEHSYKSKDPKSKNKKDLDRIAEQEDYNAADKYDSIGVEAVNKYKEKGEKEVQKYLQKALDGSEFDFKIRDEELKDSRRDGNEKYVGFTLKVIGNKYIYQTQGDDGYTDEQYFYKKK